MNACPDRLALFMSLEEDDPETRAHLESCSGCRAIAAEDRLLDDALSRLRDPAPPADLLRGVMCRVDEAVNLARRAQRQTVAVLSVLAFTVVGGLALLGPAWLVERAIDGASTLSSLRTVFSALGRSLGPFLSSVALPLLAAQAFALLIAALLLNRLVAARVRSVQ